MCPAVYKYISVQTIIIISTSRQLRRPINKTYYIKKQTSIEEKEERERVSFSSVFDRVDMRHEININREIPDMELKSKNGHNKNIEVLIDARTPKFHRDLDEQRFLEEEILKSETIKRKSSCGSSSSRISSTKSEHKPMMRRVWKFFKQAWTGVITGAGRVNFLNIHCKAQNKLKLLKFKV